LLRTLTFKANSNQSRQQIIYPYPDQFSYLPSLNQNVVISFNFNNNIHQGLFLKIKLTLKLLIQMEINNVSFLHHNSKIAITNFAKVPFVKGKF
jgi:hypothetical protein